MGQDFKKLKVLELSNKLVLETDKITKEELLGFSSPMRKGAVSIPANIAEGSGRIERDICPRL